MGLKISKHYSSYNFHPTSSKLYAMCGNQGGMQTITFADDLRILNVHGTLTTRHFSYITIGHKPILASINKVSSRSLRPRASCFLFACFFGVFLFIFFCFLPEQYMIMRHIDISETAYLLKIANLKDSNVFPMRCCMRCCGMEISKDRTERVVQAIYTNPSRN